MQRRIAGIAVLVTVGLLGVGVPAASATWATNCKAQYEPLKHCYALLTWYPTAARKVNKVWTYIDTESMYVPYTAKEQEAAHVDDETWVAPAHTGEYPWIEGGQITVEPRSHTQMYGFWAAYYSSESSVGEISESVGPADEPDRKNLYQFYDRTYLGDPAEHIWCAVWESALFGCASSISEPARELETGVEAATETAPSNYATSEPFSIGGTENRWSESGNQAEPYLTPGGGACGHREGTAPVKVWVFAAGHECGFDAVLESPFSEEPPTPVDPFEGYAATPATITAGQAKTKALAVAAAQGESAPSVSVTSSTLLAAAEAADPAAKLVRASMGDEPGQTAWEESAVYRVILSGATAYSFTSVLPLRAGVKPPHGDRLELVYEKSTGRFVRTHLWNEPEPAS